MLKQTRNVIHLRITRSTALRVILYIDASKINWYNENNLHPQVLKALQPIVLNHLVSSEQGKAVAKRRKDLETARAFDDPNFRMIYRFVWHDIHQSMLLKEHKYMQLDDNEEDDEESKPTLHTTYQPLSVYPYQLFVSVEEPHKEKSGNLDAYFSAMSTS